MNHQILDLLGVDIRDLLASSTSTIDVHVRNSDAKMQLSLKDGHVKLRVASDLDTGNHPLIIL